MNLFVYGTLMTGQPRNHLLTDSFEFLADAEIRGRLYSWGDKFPVLQLNYDVDTKVEGEIWTSTQWNMKAKLEELDDIEGVPLLFKRVYIDIENPNADPDDEDGEPHWLECETYVGANDAMFDKSNLIDTWPIEGNAGVV